NYAPTPPAPPSTHTLPLPDALPISQEDPTVVAATRGPTPREEVLDRESDRYGGFKWGAAFFGWLTAMGAAVLLTAILSAIGAGRSEEHTSELQSRFDLVCPLLPEKK